MIHNRPTGAEEFVVFKIYDNVKIKANGLNGKVIAKWDHRDDPTKYMVEYVLTTGEVKESYFTGPELESA